MTGAEAIAALPDRVRIGPYDFSIKRMTAEEGNSRQRWGECSTALQQMTVQDSFPTAIQAANTLLHEVCHAIHWAYGIEDGDKEERMVGVMGTALTALHRDNPWLAGWLTAALS